MTKFQQIFTIIFVVVFLTFVIKAIIIQKAIQTDMLENCVPTDMYTIGNRGQKTRIYNCK